MNKDLMRKMGFEKEMDEFDEGNCPLCGKRITEFRDELSKEEFKISGLCESCQDGVFK